MKKSKSKKKWTPANTQGSSFMRYTGSRTLSKPPQRSLGSRIKQGAMGVGEVAASLAGAPTARQGYQDVKGAFQKRKSSKKAMPSLKACKTCGSKKHASTAHKTFHVKHSGSFEGKSNTLGHGGRAAQLRAQGAKPALIGFLARQAHAAPGQKNYHGKK